MKPLLILLIIASLLAPASAESVNRQIIINDSTIEVVLTPLPYDNFSFPGYYVTENIPIHTSFINTTADWYKIDGYTLSMLKLAPPANNSAIKYYLTLPRESGNYSIYGTYKNKLRGTGEILVQFINVNASGSTSKGNTSWTPSPSQTHNPIPISKEIITIANQSQLSSEPPQQKQVFSEGLYIVFFSLIFLVALSRFVPKKIHKEYEFTKEFMEKHGAKL